MANDSEPRPPWAPVHEGAVPPAQALTPSKPAVPARAERETVPEPIEAEEAEVVRPVEPPAASELLPRPDAPPPPPEPPVTARPHSDPVRRLGETAATNAALSAGGAPTPLGGVPTVAGDGAMETPDFDNTAPLFTPTFQTEPPREPTSRERADALAAGIVAQEQERIAASGAQLNAGDAYTPTAFTGPDEATDAPVTRRSRSKAATQAEAVVPPPPEPGEASGTSRRWPMWVIIAVLVIAAAAVAFALTHRPEARIVPGTTITQPPPGPTITPSAVPTASAFQSAMPSAVGTFALVGATALDPAELAATAGRVADGVDLVYRSGESTVQVRALQYFTEDEATQAFTSRAGEDAATEPVTANGDVVGERAIVTSPSPGIVWRNGTSVFTVTGPAADLAGFYDQFGL